MGRPVSGHFVRIVLVAASLGSGLLLRGPGFSLVDGTSPIPPYRWVRPPPALAGTNHSPAVARFVIHLESDGRSKPTVAGTADLQFSLSLPRGALPSAGDPSTTVTVTPLAPETRSTTPPGIRIVGNVYRVKVAVQPGDRPRSGLGKPAEVTLRYPAEADATRFQHTLLMSTDGRSWRATKSTDLPADQMVQAKARTLGFFAVGQSGPTGAPNGGEANVSARSSFVPLVTAAVAIVAVLLIGFALIRRFWRRSSGDGPPTPRDEFFDAWKD